MKLKFRHLLNPLSRILISDKDLGTLSIVMSHEIKRARKDIADLSRFGTKKWAVKYHKRLETLDRIQASLKRQRKENKSAYLGVTYL